MVTIAAPNSCFGVISYAKIPEYNEFKTSCLAKPCYQGEAAAIMAKQVVAHKSYGISRWYMYHFTSRNFVSQKYAEQMLEYDGTLMPYTQAYIFCSKLLEKMKHESRSFLGSGNVVRERFTSDIKPIIDVIWDEGKNPEFLKLIMLQKYIP